MSEFLLPADPKTGIRRSSVIGIEFLDYSVELDSYNSAEGDSSWRKRDLFGEVRITRSKAEFSFSPTGSRTIQFGVK